MEFIETIKQTSNKIKKSLNNTGFMYSKYHFVDGYGNILDSFDDRDLIDGTFTMPDWINVIGSDAFRDSAIQKIVLTDGVKVINKGAFYNCKQLQNVELGNGVSEINSLAFAGCPIKTLFVPKNVNYILSDAFAHCNSLTSLIIDADLIFWKSAFRACKSLSTVTFTENTRLIGKNCFMNCPELASVNMRDSSIDLIESGAFSGCSSLCNVSFSKMLRTIGAEAFRDCSSLENIDLPDTVQTIKQRAFSGCVELREAEIPAQLNCKSDAFGQQPFDCSGLQDSIKYAVVANTTDNITNDYTNDLEDVNTL